jgi:hypothetical protein
LDAAHLYVTAGSMIPNESDWRSDAGAASDRDRELRLGVSEIHVTHDREVVAASALQNDLSELHLLLAE